MVSVCEHFTGCIFNRSRRELLASPFLVWVIMIRVSDFIFLAESKGDHFLCQWGEFWQKRKCCYCVHVPLYIFSYRIPYVYMYNNAVFCVYKLNMFCEGFVILIYFSSKALESTKANHFKFINIFKQRLRYWHKWHFVKSPQWYCVNQTGSQRIRQKEGTGRQSF